MAHLMPQVALHRATKYQTSPRFQVYTERTLDQIPQLAALPEELRFAMRVVAQVLPFRVNHYVVDQLIDWSAAPDDPIFQLTFPQQGMLAAGDFARMADLLRRGADSDAIKRLANELRLGLNPHPAGQQTLNVPHLDGEPLAGMQHKYRETVLFFPSQGQTCHSYCTFCFRWPQFVGDKSLRFSAHEAGRLHDYLVRHPEVTDLLLTGGDPMVMKAEHLSDYLLPLSRSRFDHVQNLRIGTKALSFWPQRFVSDHDADDLLRLLERLVERGKHVAIMAHYNHWRELETPVVRAAVRRLRDTGAVIRTQSPMIAHINDNADVWARLWRTQVRLGMVPYYMFAERDTGGSRYFEVPLARTVDIYSRAMRQVSGLARTARGPSMSAGPGKVEIQGIAEIGGEKVFALRFIQARNPAWVQQPFFARFDPQATWLDQLRPAFGESRFFFEDEYEAMQARAAVFAESVQ